MRRVAAVRRAASASVRPLTSFMAEERPAVGEGAQLVDRHDARVLQLAADLGLLDEPADQVGVVAVRLEQDLDGQVAAEVGVAALEDGAHAAAGDLAEELEPSRPVAGRRHLGRSRLDERTGSIGDVRIAQQHPRYIFGRQDLGQRRQDARADRPVGQAGESPGVTPLRVVDRQALAQQADRAEPFQAPVRKRIPTTSTPVFRVHDLSPR